MRNCFICSAKALDCNEPKEEGDLYIIPTVTPYLINSLHCRELICYVENKHKNNFIQIFSNELNRCTEFYLYYNRIKKINVLDELYGFRPKKYITLFSKFPQDHMVCKELLMKTMISYIKVFGLHSMRIAQLDSTEKMMILNIYDRAGLGDKIRELLAIFC